MRMPCQQMATAGRAPLAIAAVVLVVLPDLVRSLRTSTASDFHSVNALTGPADQLLQAAQ